MHNVQLKHAAIHNWKDETCVENIFIFPSFSPSRICRFELIFEWQPIAACQIIIFVGFTLRYHFVLGTNEMNWLANYQKDSNLIEIIETNDAFEPE